ncbi:class I SAM-dependent methyltransferase [Clostridium tagluense]|uniref:class I SAM-dependent methyltransferase n=1 Tax=Clostridium tagluense TaxID=360422 RepID=UPI001CF27B56|nr:class I SAM-dependent methyltransferase [Clostridium tagluense]MCB2313031.1 class I SAM-dependent methyltransferase [Clostridium tagluense]MCB2317731.1 class I SAM-dependent methyltransferase [Clostridium tagluense]MCB2322581.1 class I SAM-dependent methyltransferase [Clostridium tagluense]MCB2327514.1 class I SAM-dependent methyltransferase [Clostridium tagluense]MCB2332661.1 class I SAM-dependent methyltransferase [Clostridium tagluense]
MEKNEDKKTIEDIYDYEDILKMLDSFLKEPSPFWNKFYEDREKDIPFFIDVPDENLISYFQKEIIKSSKVLELGCGPGRNAIYMVQNGCDVDAVDISEEAITWAKERASRKNLKVNFMCDSIFNIPIQELGYDFIYDSGCLHHIPPHRRIQYVSLIEKLLKPKGYFGLVCFAAEDDKNKNGLPQMSDWEVYRRKSLRGGIGYTEEKLRNLFSKNFEIVEFRRMIDIDKPDVAMGKSFLWAVLLKKKR